MRNTRTSPRRRTGLVATAVTAALVLAGCGGDKNVKNAAGAHNAQDVSFAQGMIPHHRQALEMAELAAGRASSAKVESLAGRIEKAQDPEIRTMSGWLKGWDATVPSPMTGMDHSAHAGMAGMMDDKDMKSLRKASGKDFDTMFLTMMVEHHEGAVKMAETEKAKGAYAPATSMADDIIEGQTAEITEMNNLLGRN